MNIIRALPGLVLYLLAPYFGHTALTPIGPLTNGIVIVDGGLGTTGNITPPNLVSLQMALP